MYKFIRIKKLVNEIVCPECGNPVATLSNYDSFKILNRLKNREIYLFGEIECVIVQEIIEELMYLERLDNTKIISLYINSEGGDIDSGFALIDIIKGLKSPIRTVALGEVCSMASGVFVSGTKGYREIAKNTWIMFHPITAGAGEDYVKFQKSRILQAEQLEKQYDNIILSNTNIPKAEYIKAKDTELWIPAKTALDYGIADKYFIGNIEIEK